MTNPQCQRCRDIATWHEKASVKFPRLILYLSFSLRSCAKPITAVASRRGCGPLGLLRARVHDSHGRPMCAKITQPARTQPWMAPRSCRDCTW